MLYFITGKGRTQTTLFLASFDDFISDSNSVRIVDYFVDDLDFAVMGFDRINLASTGVIISK